MIFFYKGYSFTVFFPFIFCLIEFPDEIYRYELPVDSDSSPTDRINYQVMHSAIIPSSSYLTWVHFERCVKPSSTVSLVEGQKLCPSDGTTYIATFPHDAHTYTQKRKKNSRILFLFLCCTAIFIGIF